MVSELRTGLGRAITPRTADRRLQITQLLAALTRAVQSSNDVTPLRLRLEEILRRVFPLSAVHIREAGPRSTLRETAAAGEAVGFPVQGPEGAPVAVLEARFDAGRAVGEWDVQVLGLSAHVAALVLEIDRQRAQLARAGLLPSVRPRADGAAPLIGSTPAMRTLRTTIERVAGTDFTVLLDGESGVGKELVARQIHERSRRRNGPFVAINCAALVETLLEAELFGIEDRTATGVRGRRGQFENADGGTLFLDEVSDLSLSAQAKLLRTIQDLAVQRVGAPGTRRVDIRIVAATNRSLSQVVERGLFRADLFYRLSGVDVRVPTLRERRADILDLARHFLDRHRTSRSLRLSPAAADALVTYDWPGNVRELERLIERVVTLAESDVIELDDLPPTVRGDYAAVVQPSLARNDTMRAWGSRYARLVLERCHGNKREACRVLDLSYHTLQAYLGYSADRRMVPARAELANAVAHSVTDSG